MTDITREQYLRKTVAKESVALVLWLIPVYWVTVAMLNGAPPIDWPVWKMVVAPLLFALSMVIHIPIHQ